MHTSVCMFNVSTRCWHSTALHYITLHYVALHYITLLEYVSLHQVLELYFITLLSTPANITISYRSYLLHVDTIK